MNNIRKREAEIQDIFHLQLFDILIIDCHIIAQPHIAQKNQQVALANHCQIASLFHFHLVSVNSSIKVKVINDSVNQIIANIREYGAIIHNNSNNGTSITGIWKLGNDQINSLYPFSDKYDETVLTHSNHGTNITSKVTKIIATRPEGTAFVNFGKKWIIAIVNSIRNHIINSCELANHSPPTLNWLICAKNIIIASQLTKPSITGWGISLTNFANQNTPNNIWNIHINIKVAKRYSIPWVATSDVITTAKAQVAPEIIPGLPPNIEVKSHTIKAACNQTIGLIQATKEKAIASGIKAKATVNHDKISDFNWDLFLNSSNIHVFLKKVSNSIFMKIN